MASSSGSAAAAPSPKSDEPDVLDAMGRKVWDKEHFIEKAKSNIMFGPERIGRRKDPVIPLPSSQRTFLKQRATDLNIEKDLGKFRTVTTHTIKPMQGGYWCSVCECLLKDSSTYLEHVNGRRHNRNLGMNMKVEKIGVDRVREKLKAMRKKPEAIEAEDIEARIAALEREQEEKKRRKKEKKKKKNKKGGGGGGGGEAGEEAEDGEDEEDEDAITGDERPDKEPAAKRAKGEDGGQERGEEDDESGEEDEETEEMKMLKMMGLPTGFG